MKKLVILLSMFLLLTGCNNQEKKEATMNFDDKYYEINKPYKVGVGNNYVKPSVITTYDYEKVDAGLMDISVSYFDPDELKFQAGQYLTEEKLTTLLSDESLNKTPEIIKENQKIKPNYITSIHEQNFLNKNNKLVGISLAIVLNPYQEYKNSSGTYLYKAMNIEDTIKFGQEKAQELIKEIRQMKNLKDIKIMTALYVTGNPNEITGGNFEYIGVTNNNKITFEKLDYQTNYLTANYVLEKDLNNYTAFNTLNKNIQKEVDNIYITAIGLYVNNHLNKIEMTVNSSLLTKDKLLMVSQLLAEEISKQFDEKLLIKGTIKINNNTKALIVKKRNEIESNIYLLT
ncbi:MAG: CamS family sex pheromone protein [Bacilli bacterium]